MTGYVVNMVIRALRDAKSIDEVKGALNLFFADADDSKMNLIEQWQRVGKMMDMWRDNNL